MSNNIDITINIKSMRQAAALAEIKSQSTFREAPKMKISFTNVFRYIPITKDKSIVKLSY